MKKILLPIVGAIAGGVICNLLFWLLGRLAIFFDLRLYDGEQESSRNFIIFLIVLILFILIGAFWGYLKGHSKSIR